MSGKLSQPPRWSRHCGEMIPDAGGLWVKYDDVEPLLTTLQEYHREFARIHNKLNRLKRMVNP